MNKSKIVSLALLSALGVAAYIAILVWVMNNAQHWFNPSNSYISGIAMLMLFVISATIVGGLVLLRPVMWYHGGSKKEAVYLLGATVGWLAVFTIIVFTVIAVTK